MIPRELGQLLVIKLDQSRWTASLERLLHAYRPCGVFLQALRTPEATAELLRQIARALETPPLLGLEEEGGRVDPLAALFPPLPSPRSVAEQGVRTVMRFGDLIGGAMSALGFNTNLAPALDLGTRAFSADAGEVARCGEAFVRGLRRHKVLPCAKHFPGLGGLGAGARRRPAVIDKPMAAMWREDLVPYRQLLPHLPLALISHAAYKAYDFDVLHAAAQSANIVEGLLRVKLHYEGLAVADLARTEDDREPLELGEAAVRSVKAGCDLVMIAGREESLEAVLAALARAMESGNLRADRLEESFVRIRRTKKGLRRPSGRIPKSALDRIARQFENFRNETGLPSAKPRSGSRNPAPNEDQEPELA